MRIVFVLSIPIILLVAMISFGESPPSDRISMTAKAVVQAQLEALQNNDTPAANYGIGVAWEYAHPKNKAATGPLARFTTMLQSPAYEPLLNHRSHSVRQLEARDGVAAFEVLVVTQAGYRLKYLWTVERVNRDDTNSPWRTTAVSAPVQIDGDLA